MSANRLDICSLSGKLQDLAVAVYSDDPVTFLGQRSDQMAANFPYANNYDAHDSIMHSYFARRSCSRM